MKRRAPLVHDRSIWLFTIPGLFLVGFLALPILAIGLRAVREGFLHYAFTPNAIAALKLSLVTSLICVLIIIAAGTPLAFALARWRFGGRGLVELLVDLPIVLPPSVAGLGLLIAFGRQGLLGSSLRMFGISLPFTTAAVVMAQIFVAAPLFVRAARIGFAGVDPQLEESAYVEGASHWILFRRVMLPLTSRALLGGAILSWTRALGEFGATILFAGNLVGRTQTMPLAIYLGFESSLGMALALSAMLVVVSIVMLAALRRLETQTEESH